MHKHQRKKGSAMPQVLPGAHKYLLPQRVGVSGAAAASDNHDYHGIGRWEDSSQRSPPSLGGPHLSNLANGSRRPPCAICVLIRQCDAPWRKTLDRPTPPWVGAHLREAKPSVMSGPCRWGPWQASRAGSALRTIRSER